MARSAEANGNEQISSFDGKAPDSTGENFQLANSSVPKRTTVLLASNRDQRVLLTAQFLLADFSNYFCTYAFLYHQVIFPWMAEALEAPLGRATDRGCL